MILQALSRYYQRLIEQGAGGIAPYGYSPEKISYEIVLAPDGAVLAVHDIRDTTGKKPKARRLEVPQPEKRTVDIKSNFLWDKTSYVLGVSAASKRADKEHEAFKALHEASLAAESDEGLKALLAFLKAWSPEQFQAPLFPTEMLDTNVVFRLGDEHRWLHEREAARAAWGRRQTEASDGNPLLGVCLVSGRVEPLARLHPAIKGVPGAQPAGAAIVSFNDDAYISYKGSKIKAESAKKENNSGANAPISKQAAFAYTSVLNYLLRSGDNQQRLQVGDTTVVFWAEAAGNEEDAQAAEGFLASLFLPPDDGSEAERLRVVLDGLGKGRPLVELDPGLAPGTRMYVLGLAPNASRLSVRYWQVDTLEVFAKRLALHAQDLHIEPLPWRVEPTAWRLALALAPSRGGRAKSEDVPPSLAGELMRAILTGNRYPSSLLTTLTMRMRTDGDMSGVRVALCKAVLVRNLRFQKSTKEIPVSLDLAEANPGYLLGRLFYFLERAQQRALGSVNAGVKDKYYGAASATPSLVFPVMVRNFENHIAKLRKGDERDKGAARGIEREVAQIIDKLPTRFPSHLSIEDQGRFAIGYYHQSQAHFTKRDATGDAADDTDTEGAQS